MYLQVGGNGYLGRYLRRSIQQNTADEIIAAARHVPDSDEDPRVTWCSCDVLDGASVDSLLNHLGNRSDQKIIYLAAYHHPDEVEKHPDLAWECNVMALASFLNKICGLTARLFYVSSDSVYGNSINGHHFREDAPLNPVNTYGHHKAAAEALTIHSGNYVVRFPFLIGPSLVPGRTHFYDVLREKLLAGETIEMFQDSYRSSQHFATAASLLVRLIETDGEVPRCINLCGDEDLSKYDVGLRQAQSLGVPGSQVKPISIDSKNSYFEAKRASSTLMDNTLAKKVQKTDKIRFSITLEGADL